MLLFSNVHILFDLFNVLAQLYLVNRKEHEICFIHFRYVVVWKKVDGNLYLYTDIFNTNKKA